MWSVTVDPHLGLVEIDVDGRSALFSRDYIDDEQAAGIEWWLDRAPADTRLQDGATGELAGAIFQAIASGRYEDGKAVAVKGWTPPHAKNATKSR
jgi:hypothetical protein